MKFKLFLLLSVLITLYSCQADKTDKNMYLLQGEWQAIDEEDLDAYIFETNNKCIYKPGFYTHIDPNWEKTPISIEVHEHSDTPFIHTHLGNINKYFGYDTQYQIQNDSLLIYNPAKEVWKRYKINFLSPDSLLFNSQDDTKLFTRKQYPEDTTTLYDKIVLYLPVEEEPPVSTNYFAKRLSIDKSGEVLYVVSYVEKGIFSAKGKINIKHVKYLESLFKESDITSQISYNNNERELSTRLGVPRSSITFIKNNEMVCLESPLNHFHDKEFIWAYMIALFCDEVYITITENDLNNLGFSFMNLEFRHKDKILYLTDSEQFYLFTLLYDAPKTDVTFMSKYEIHTYNGTITNYKQVVIETDGRYYRYLKNGEIVTLDIGFNFIEVNNLENSFEKERSFGSILLKK